MNRRDVLYWVVYLTKVTILGGVIVPLILYVVSHIYTWINGGIPPDDFVRHMTGASIAILVGGVYYKFLMGHREAIDKYYDDLEQEE